MKQKFDITFDDTDLIRSSEGHSLTAYPDPVSALGKACQKAKISLFNYKNLPGWEKLKADPWTISYGLTGPWVKQDTVLTEQESKDKYLNYIKTFCNDLDTLVQVELNKNQYVALLSLMWNIGKKSLSSSTVLKKVNVQDFAGAAAAFALFDKAGGVVNQGLVARRQREAKLFATSPSPTNSGSLNSPELADAIKNLETFASKA